MTRIASMTLLAASLGTLTAQAQEKNPVVELDTSMGKIKIELLADKAPITAKNFLGYVDSKHYDGTIFHRVIPDFMIQGGGFAAGMQEKKTRDPIKNEAGNGVSNKRGTIAMARTPRPRSKQGRLRRLRPRHRRHGRRRQDPRRRNRQPRRTPERPGQGRRHPLRPRRQVNWDLA
jgi:hypothetical protein